MAARRKTIPWLKRPRCKTQVTYQRGPKKRECRWPEPLRPDIGIIPLNVTGTQGVPALLAIRALPDPDTTRGRSRGPAPIVDCPAAYRASTSRVVEFMKPCWTLT